MSENSIISGWNIKHGDYKSDVEYDIKYVHDRKQRKQSRRIMAFLTGLVAFFLILLTLNLFSNI
jgi:hypothetical protein